MEAEDVPARATAAGAVLSERLRELPAVTAVRGLGLLLAVELDTERLGVAAGAVAALLLQRGVVVNAVTPTALRLAPSLLISDDEVDAAVDAVAAALDDLAAHRTEPTP
jgi:acetylornithine aminotransferase